MFTSDRPLALNVLFLEGLLSSFNLFFTYVSQDYVTRQH